MIKFHEEIYIENSLWLSFILFILNDFIYPFAFIYIHLVKYLIDSDDEAFLAMRKFRYVLYRFGFQLIM